jgi:hypothetical protein
MALYVSKTELYITTAVRTFNFAELLRAVLTTLSYSAGSVLM